MQNHQSHSNSVCLFTGDINIQKRSTSTSVFKFAQNVLLQSDLLYGNLEGCIYPIIEKNVNKKNWKHSDVAIVKDLVSVKFDVLGCANNAMMGHKAILNTLKILTKAKIKYCGAGKNNKEANKPIVITRKGVRFGFIQVTARIHSERWIATEDSPGISYFNPENESDFLILCNAITELKQKVDIVVFSHHIRTSGSREVENYQKKLAYKCIDAGADIIFAHGAHLIQEIEYWKGVPIFHCIGHLAFDNKLLVSQKRKEGLIIRIELENKKIRETSAFICTRDKNDCVIILNPTRGRGKEIFSNLCKLSPGILFTCSKNFINVSQK